MKCKKKNERMNPKKFELLPSSKFASWRYNFTMMVGMECMNAMKISKFKKKLTMEEIHKQAG